MEILMTSALFFVLSLLASLGLRVIEEMERTNRLAEAELQASELYRESLDSRVEQVRRYRHDADGLLRAVESMMGQDATSASKNRASANTASRLGESGSALVLDTGLPDLPLADAAIQSHRRSCADVGIAFTCEVDPAFASETTRRGVSEPDLCIVLQNLLDNAFEASLEAKEAGIEPRMTLFMDLPDGGMRIAVGNRTVSAEPPVFRTRKDDPHLHGVGLEVVRDIARIYRGSLTPSFDSSTRTLTMTVRL